VLQEEENYKGLIGWKDYKEFFSYSKCGIWGVALIVFCHFVINATTLAVSVYLGLTLTNHFEHD